MIDKDTGYDDDEPRCECGEPTDQGYCLDCQAQREAEEWMAFFDDLDVEEDEHPWEREA